MSLSHAFAVSVASVALLALLGRAAAQLPTPNAPFMQAEGIEAVPNLDVWDEFDGPLDLNKWSVHGIENPDTKCPKWNGPPSTSHPEYSVFYAGSTNAKTGEPNSVASYKVKNGKLRLWVQRKGEGFFSDREYYCNSTTYKCNHDDSIDCFPTRFDGSPNYQDEAAGTYWGVSHDKCKIEPHCIPSPEHVTRKAPVYGSFVGPHLASRATVRYGFIETRVRTPKTSALLAVWMHSDQFVNGYCRYRQNPDDPWPVHECPSAIRTRQWGEIDIVEAINSASLKKRYVPNIHVFSDNKGEFSDANASPRDDGQMGDGPIVVLENEFSLANPDFSGLPEAGKVANDFHYNPGSVKDLDNAWGDAWHTVGVYWSAQEIRFYLDGEEVRRVENKLVHIPMQIDITMAFNVGWAGELPAEVRRHVGKVDYIRAWDINTEDGFEVPYVNEVLDTPMTTQFSDLYGNTMRGVHGLFPQMDAYTLTPLDQTARMSAPNVTAGLLPGMSRVRQARATVRQARAEKLVPTASVGVRRPLSRPRRAGGQGNQKRLRRRRRRSRSELNILYSNPGRIAEQAAPGVEPATLADPERSATEDTNPNKAQAGWACPSNDCTGAELG